MKCVGEKGGEGKKRRKEGGLKEAAHCWVVECVSM